jgi:hypothetical protein
MTTTVMMAMIITGNFTITNHVCVQNGCTILWVSLHIYDVNFVSVLNHTDIGNKHIRTIQIGVL